MVKDKTKMWRYSPKKKLLLQRLEDGEVGQSDKPRQVYLMHKGFWQFKYENFTNNLQNLKIKVMQSKGRAVVDAVGFEND